MLDLNIVPLQSIHNLTTFVSIGLEIIFFLTLLVFAVYTLFLAYHWFAYGINKATAMLILAIYLLGSAPFILIMSISF